MAHSAPKFSRSWLPPSREGLEAPDSVFTHPLPNYHEPGSSESIQDETGATSAYGSTESDGPNMTYSTLEDGKQPLWLLEQTYRAMNDTQGGEISPPGCAESSIDLDPMSTTNFHSRKRNADVQAMGTPRNRAKSVGSQKFSVRKLLYLSARVRSQRREKEDLVDNSHKSDLPYTGVFQIHKRSRLRSSEDSDVEHPQTE